jgi:hypothetical protein
MNGVAGLHLAPPVALVVQRGIIRDFLRISQILFLTFRGIAFRL